MNIKQTFAAVVMAVAAISGSAQVLVPPREPVVAVSTVKADVKQKTYGSIDEFCAEYNVQLKHVADAARQAQKEAKENTAKALEDPNAPDPQIMEAMCRATKMLRADNTSRLPIVHGSRVIR